MTATILIAVSCQSSDSVPELTPPERVLVILVDTLRADVLGAYGAEDSVSRTIDHLAADGVTFTAARSTSSWTKPAVASLFTGFSPIVHGVEKGSVPDLRTGDVDVLSPEFETLAELAAGAGLATACFTANPHVAEETGLTQGFDVIHRSTHRGSALAAKFLAWLNQDDLPSRWLAYVHFMNTHLPYAASALYAERHAPSPEAPEQVIPKSALRGLSRQQIRDTEDLRVYRARYRAALHEIDDQIGIILEHLQELDLLDGTLVVFLSDHGEEFLDHGGLSHGHTLYEEMLRIPLIFYSSADRELLAGRRVDAAVSLVDLYPTLVDVLGLEAPQPPGRSLAPLIFDQLEAAQPQSHLATHTSMRKSEDRLDVLVEDKWKLIRTAAGPRSKRTVELYDLESDPGETRNLAEDYPGEVERLLAAMDAARDSEEALREELGRAPGEVELDERQAEELRSLGYVN